MKDLIIRFRTFLLKHFKNKRIRTLIYGLISYEMISYMFFGAITTLVDFTVYSALTYMHINILIANIISTICAIIFAYVTNKLWVFNSNAHTVPEILLEFIKFSEARIATLIMSEIILWISHVIHGNPYVAKIIAMILTVIINYILSKLFIFTSKKQKGNKKS